jgi:hypothetical protein
MAVYQHSTLYDVTLKDLNLVVEVGGTVAGAKANAATLSLMIAMMDVNKDNSGPMPNITNDCNNNNGAKMCSINDTLVLLGCGVGGSKGNAVVQLGQPQQHPPQCPIVCQSQQRPQPAKQKSANEDKEDEEDEENCGHQGPQKTEGFRCGGGHRLKRGWVQPMVHPCCGMCEGILCGILHGI